jgi:hypothetical protein
MKWSILPLVIILGGWSVMETARYKIRRICEKYPIEVQLVYGACCEHGGPWPQKTNATESPQQSGSITNLLDTSTTNLFQLAYSTNWQGTNFLTITNRAWLQFNGVAIIRVTDSEWTLLTNSYPSNLVKGPIEFYK